MDLDIASLKQRLENYERDFRDFKQNNTTTHKEIFTRLNKIEHSYIETNAQYNQIISTLDEVKLDVKTLKEKPTKRYDTIISALISLLISGIGMYIISKMLGG